MPNRADEEQELMTFMLFGSWPTFTYRQIIEALDIQYEPVDCESVALYIDSKLPESVKYTITTIFKTYSLSDIATWNNIWLSIKENQTTRLKYKPVYLSRKTETFTMLQIIDQLLSRNEYNIYQNNNIDADKLQQLTEYFCQVTEKELIEYFQLEKCSTKFCWMNYVNIIARMEFPHKWKGISVLFEFLKDANWPVFEPAVKVLSSYPREELFPYLEQYLVQAYCKKDDMWILGMKTLDQRIKMESYAREIK